MKRLLPAALFAAAALLFFEKKAAAQQAPSMPFVDGNAPGWMRLLASPDPNVFEVEKAYRDHFADRPFEKNSHTQYYKHWMHFSRKYTRPDGFLKFPTDAEQADWERHLQILRKEETAARSAANWTFVGPKNTYDTDGSARVTWQTNIYSVAVAPSDANTVYAGGETGGLWKSTDKGQTWQLLTKNVLHGSFGAIAVHPADPGTVWASTSGKIIKTTDGGSTWATSYSASGFWANELAVSPADPNTVLAAADQGLLRSTDGGANWTKLFTNKSWAVKFKPGDPATVFATRRNGSGMDFLKSTNAGATFSPSNSGLWSPGSGQTVEGAMLATCPSNPSKIYAFVNGEGGNLGGFVGVFVSTNSGLSWANTNPSNQIGQPYSIPNHTNLMDADGVDWFWQGFYDMAIVVNPSNENQLIAGGCSWFRSNDGGKTWPALGAYVGGLAWSHPDLQALAVSGNDLWIASDGGLNYSNDWAATIEARMNGISGADMWGFGSGWNEDLLVGGRYHNGNSAWHESFPPEKHLRMGGAESATGYVSPGPGQRTYFSDIGNYRVLPGFGNDVSYFGNSPVYPNESYAYYANSEMVWHPNCWNTIFLGFENKLFRSDDGGASFAETHAFPGTADNKVYGIEICRADPSAMFCAQWNGTDDDIWRTTDGGLSWAKCALLPLPNNNDRVKLALSETDPKTLWAAVTYGSNGKKIYQTTDGGTSWQNLTTTALNEATVQDILPQFGTDGGLYLGTNAGVFYRNNAMADWQPYSTGLPLSVETVRLKPFYRDGKIRNGTYGFGIWESPFFEPSGKPMAVAMADKLVGTCSRDTFYFDDHSAVAHAGASWSWEFPGAAQVFGQNTRRPKVLFGKTGQFAAIMSLATPFGTSRDTIYISIPADECAPNSIPGRAVRLGGNSAPSSVALPPMGISTNKLTVTAWVKTNGIQPEYSSIFMFDGADAAGFNFRPGTNRLGYHWPGGQWWWDSGPICPVGEWAHVAMVVEPTGITLYVNGFGAKHNFSVPSVNFDATCQLGSYRGWGGRYVDGFIEEVAVFDRALTQNEVREQMHLVKNPAADSSLIHYYQFNESGAAGSRIYDKAGSGHASLTGAAARVRSTCPVGPGIFSRKNVAATGKTLFGKTGLEIGLPGPALPSGDVVVTRLFIAPDTAVSTGATNLPSYWIVKNFGANASFAAPNSLTFKHLGSIAADLPANAVKLYRRATNGEGPTWQLAASSSSVGYGPGAAAGFGTVGSLTGAAQLHLGIPGWYPTGADSLDDSPISLKKSGVATVVPPITAWPNPVAAGADFFIKTEGSGPTRLRLFDEKGHAVRVLTFEDEVKISTAGLKKGAYFYRIEGAGWMRGGRVLVE